MKDIFIMDVIVHKNRLFLIGMRACGKSTIGKTLAKKLAWSFVDTDALLEKEYNCSISSMVERDGWEIFRQRESKILGLCVNDNTIYSTGGGMVLAKENREFMQENGQVCFLSVPAKTLVERLMLDAGNRPALTSKGLISEIESVLNERVPLYQLTAHYEIDATKPIDMVIADIIGRMKIA